LHVWYSTDHQSYTNPTLMDAVISWGTRLMLESRNGLAPINVLISNISFSQVTFGCAPPETAPCCSFRRTAHPRRAWSVEAGTPHGHNRGFHVSVRAAPNTVYTALCVLRREVLNFLIHKEVISLGYTQCSVEAIADFIATHKSHRTHQPVQLNAG
jgi:hypothetical protein